MLFSLLLNHKETSQLLLCHQEEFECGSSFDDVVSLDKCEAHVTEHRKNPDDQVFKDYFGGLDEESIRDNFVVIYELMDETLDFGYPQSLDAKILREYVINAAPI